eukprot:Seg3463.2 transcript_id=Seg3463.2/GoldUCD/mRNA.D3Y31 product="Myc-associated zinc finger protein" protein_id=Seg3463.2/GoldUCD/D3Y31
MRSFISSRQPNGSNKEEMEETVNVSESVPEMVDSDDDDVILVADNRCTPPAMATSSGQSADAYAANQITKQQKQSKIKKEHKCTICGKVFDRVYRLNRHLLIHKDSKAFPCSI